MILKSTWTFSISKPTTLPRSSNLELVKLLHYKLGLEIGGEKIPAISYSGICGHCSTSKDFFTFQPDTFYQLSLCGLSETTSKAVVNLDLAEKLEFLGATFNIINREDKITSYEELYTNLVANEPAPVRQFEMQFTTPTAFSQQSTTLPLPLPNLMFRSWLDRWNHFAPVYLGGDELLMYLNNAIFLKHHKIQTRSVHLHKGYVNGFIGDVTLQVYQRADSLIANVADLLVQYAEFAGTGMKTRLGMGRTNLKSIN